MPKAAPPLALSPSERIILEAVVASDQIPGNVKKRARVVLMAADGADNCTIAREVSLARSRVLFWRRRFPELGIRGLWDRDGVLPRDRIPEEVEQAIVFDCLYRSRLSGDVSVQMLWDLKWTPLSRPFFARNKLMPGGVLGLSFWGGYGSPPPAIPALESALGSHPCGALSSVQVPSL